MSWVSVGLAVGGAILGNEKHNAQMNAQEEDAKRAAATERFSPWTGMHGGAIRHPDSSQFGDIAGGAFGGYMSAQGLQNQKTNAWDQLQNSGKVGATQATAANMAGQQMQPSYYGRGPSINT